jgi:hypothetical protein
MIEQNKPIAKFKEWILSKRAKIKRGSSISYIITIIFTTGVITLLANTSDTVVYPRKITGSLHNQFVVLRDNYNYFTEEVTKEELMSTWVELYADATYRLDGNPRYNQFDCISAVINCLNNRFGANFSNENVEDLDKRIDTLVSLGLITLKTKYNHIEIKDLIIFASRDGWHCAIVCDKNKGLIQYIDINGHLGRMGIPDVAWDSRAIRKIVKISFPLWIGDLLEKYKY